MSELEIESDGSVITPNLHDSKLVRIDFGRQQLNIYFQCAESIFFRLVLRSIELMLGAQLAEENIVLNVVLTEGVDVTDDVLSSIFSAKTEAQQRYVAAIRGRLSNGSLKLLEISPSYGGEITILCESIEYEEVGRPF